MTSPTLYVGASTKMYLGEAQTLRWLDGISHEMDSRPDLAEAGIVSFVIPSLPLIAAARDRLAPRGVVIGAQTVASGSGAVTGEVSAALLGEMSVGLAVIGHAERRAQFGETDAVVALKVAAAQQAGVGVLLCVGELKRGDAADAVRFCLGQVRAALGDDLSRLAGVIIAYEPVWAIGAKQPAGARHINAVADGLRAVLGASVAVIYGGSAGPGLLSALPSLDGLFLGRFAHNPVNFGLVLDEALERRDASTRRIPSALS